MNNKLLVINLYLSVHSMFVDKGLSLVNNKSIWVKLFPFMTRYKGSITLYKDGNISSLIVTYFVNNNVKSFSIKYSNGVITSSDENLNDDFESKIELLHKMICKYNTFNVKEYNDLCKKIRANGERRAKTIAKKSSYTIKPIKRK